MVRQRASGRSHATLEPASEAQTIVNTSQHSGNSTCTNSSLGLVLRSASIPPCQSRQRILTCWWSGTATASTLRRSPLLTKMWSVNRHEGEDRSMTASTSACRARTLNQWLASLDPDAIPPFDTARTDWKLPTYKGAFGNWVFRFRAFPKRADRRVVQGPTVGMFGPPKPIWVNDHSDLMDRIGRKSRKYGELDRPLVIALLYEQWTANAHHLTRALFGWAWGYPEMFRARRIEPTWPPGADGAWLTRNGPTNRNGAAILCAFHLAPHSVAKTGLYLLHHPWARRPLTASLPFADTRVSLEGGEVLETVATTSVNKLFGLPSVWPPSVPFPKEPTPQ